MLKTTIRPEHRSHIAHNTCELKTNRHIHAYTPQVRQQLTYAATAANTHDQAITSYRPAAFHTIERGNNYPYPFEDISHLLITRRYFSATLPSNEIVASRHVF